MPVFTDTLNPPQQNLFPKLTTRILCNSLSCALLIFRDAKPCSRMQATENWKNTMSKPPPKTRVSSPQNLKVEMTSILDDKVAYSSVILHRMPSEFQVMIRNQMRRHGKSELYCILLCWL